MQAWWAKETSLKKHKKSYCWKPFDWLCMKHTYLACYCLAEELWLMRLRFYCEEKLLMRVLTETWLSWQASPQKHSSAAPYIQQQSKTEQNASSSTSTGIAADLQQCGSMWILSYNYCRYGKSSDGQLLLSRKTHRHGRGNWHCKK